MTDGNLDIGAVSSAFSDYGQELLNAPNGTIIPTRLETVSGQNQQIRGKECAEYINDVIGERIF